MTCLTLRFVLRIALASAVFTGITSSTDAGGTPYEPRLALEVSAPQQLVIGFPMMVTLRINNSNYHYPEGSGDCTVNDGLLTLASRHVGGRGLLATFQGEGGAVARIGSIEEFVDRGVTGYPIGGMPRHESVGKLAWFHPGETYSTTIDLNQLAAAPGLPPAWGDEPGPGAWEVTLKLGPPHRLQSKEFRVVVRAPTDAERQAAESLHPAHSGRTWFPDVVFTDNPVPSTEGLAPETRIAVELIAVLRAAVASPERGLDAIDSRAGLEWGYLAHLVNTVEYECSLEAKAAGRAEAARKRCLDGGSDALELRLVDSGEGLIRRLRQLRQ